MNWRPASALTGLGFFYVVFTVQLGPFAWEFPAGVALLVAAAAAARRGTLIDRRVDREALAHWSRQPDSEERKEAIAVIHEQMVSGLAWSILFGAGFAGAVAVLYVWVK